VIAHKALDDTILERMKADDGQSTARLQCIDSLFETLLNGFKFTIDIYAYRLKGFRRRVLAAGLAPDDSLDEPGKLTGCSDRLLLTATTYLARYPGCCPFFSIPIQHCSYRFFRRIVQPVRCALSFVRVHAHIERTIQPKTETPALVVELRRRHTEIE
jgi:hypothetical protein